MSSVVASVKGRLRAPLQGRADQYAFCAEDGFWFRPAYTGGTCPLCGEAAPGGAPPLKLLLRIDRFWMGLAALAVVSIAMTVLVLVTYFGG